MDEKALKRIERARKQVAQSLLKTFDKVMTGKGSKSDCIRLQCASCYGYSISDSGECDVITCPFFYHNPYLKRHMKRKALDYNFEEDRNLGLSTPNPK